MVSRVIRNIDGKNNSYYCRPIHAQCIEELLPILDGQVKHTKAKQQEVEPINDTIAEEQPTEQPKEEPKPFGIPRGGEREASNCIPLTEIEASHTSDAYKKVSEKAHRRFGKDRTCSLRMFFWIK